MLDKIKVGGKLSAIIIRKGADVKTSTFFSPPELFFQLAIFKREKNFVESPHRHKTIVRKVNRVEQFLFLLSGKMRVNFFDNKKKIVKSSVIKKGDAILLIRGIHSLKILETTKAISLKQGPFLGDKDDKVLIDIKK